MPIRLSGLTSGLDTDALVKELVSAYSIKTQKYTKEQTRLSWKQDAWKSLNAKIYSLYTNISNMRFSSAYTTKKASSSDVSKATVSAGGAAVNGSQKLNVLSTAQAGYMTGGKIKARELTGDTSLKDLGFDGDASFWVNVTKEDGTESSTEIKVDAFDGTLTINDVVGQLNDAGIEAKFEDNKIVFQAKEGEQFSIRTTADGTGVNADGIRALSALGLKAMDSSKLDPEDFADGKFEGNEIKFKKDIELKDGKLTSETTMEQLGFDHYIGVNFNVKTTDEDGKEKNTKIKIEKDTKIEDVVKQLQEAGLNANFDEKNGRIYVSSKTTGKDSDFEITALTDHDGEHPEEAEKALSLLGLKVGDGENDAKKIDGRDAQIRLNGVLYESNTNNFEINGLNITAQGITGDGEENAITINTNTDTQAIYDKIKDFLTEYNNLINEITKLYNADSSRGYDPLTDDEKDAMSDTEIEKWETKIKDSLLRRDSSLDSVMSAMITSMSTSYEVNGKQYSLSSFGIQTLGFLNAAENEQNAYHIDGDEDDVNSSGKKDKLMAAINEDPDTVIEFMKQLASGLYSAIDSKMKSTELSSAYKVYNDKEMDKQYANYTKLISQWEDRVAEKEDYYYKKFSAMEAALAKLQSQTNSLTGLFGG